MRYQGGKSKIANQLSKVIMTAKGVIFPEDKCTNVFEDREISELVWDVFDLIHSFNWYKSGDTDKSDYLKAKG